MNIPNELKKLQISDSTQKYFVHNTAVVDEGCAIGLETKVWHFSHIMSKASIGRNCIIGQNVFIADGVIIGNNVKVQNNVSIYKGVVCEDDVFLGPSMVFTNVINPRSTINRKSEYRDTIVRRGATIGANATIICGNEIGAYAMIGAGSVVTKNITAYALIVGNPAKQIGWISESGYQLTFDKNGKAICTNSNDQYQLVNSKVTKLIPPITL